MLRVKKIAAGLSRGSLKQASSNLRRLNLYKMSEMYIFVAVLLALPEGLR